jgi:cytochrome c oxidase subunit 3
MGIVTVGAPPPIPPKGLVVELRPHARHDFTQSLGMMVALGSWSMMFGALFFMYFGARSRAPIWPPPGVPALPVVLPALNTLILLASSAALWRGVGELARGRRKALAPWVGASMVLGVAFVALQFVMWKALWVAGLLPQTGVYGSLFYGLTALHAVHVAAGLVVLAVVFVRALTGTYTEHNAIRVRVAAMFWHFVDAVWLLMFFALYLL